MNIRKKVNYLKRKFNTDDPFAIADYLGIAVIFEDLGRLNGYYNKQLRMKQIHINKNLPYHLQKFTCAHELGHSQLHPNSNTNFLQNYTGFSVDRLEIQANKFAVELLISDELLNEYSGYTTNQMARLLGYHERLIELRLKE